MVDPVAAITSPGYAGAADSAGGNTTIGVVATNARLDVERANKLAQVAHDGLALAVRPAHTMSDGDTMFALATARYEGPADVNRLCAAAALSVGRAIARGVREASGLGGVPSAREVTGGGAGLSRPRGMRGEVP